MASNFRILHTPIHRPNPDVYIEYNNYLEKQRIIKITSKCIGHKCRLKICIYPLVPCDTNVFRTHI